MKKVLVIIWLVISGNFLLAQQVWQKSFKNIGGTKFIAPNGKILIKGEKTLMCISNVDGNLLWTEAIKADANIGFLGLDMLSISDNSNLELRDINNGVKVEWNNQNYISSTLIQHNGHSLIIASNDNKTDAISYNQKNKNFNTVNINNSQSFLNNFYFRADTAFIFFNNGLAKIDIATPNTMFFVKIIKSINTVEDQLNQYQKIAFIDTDIIVNYNGYLTRINNLTGKIIWQQELPSSLSKISFNKTDIFVNYFNKKNSELIVYDAITGQKKLNQSIKSPYILASTFYDNKIFALTTPYVAKNLSLIDLKTLTITIQKLVKISNIYYKDIDFFNNTIMISGDDGYLFVDPKSYQIKSVFSGTYDFKSIAIGSKKYFFNHYSGKLVEQDFETLTQRNLNAEKVNFKTQENDHINISFDDGAFIISGNQSIVKLGLDGKEIYNVYFPPPGEGTGKILGKVLVAAATSYGSYVSGSNAQNSNSLSSKQYWSDIQKSYQSLSNSLDLSVNKRFSKSFDDINTIAMVTKSDNEKSRIVKVDKKDGKIIGEVKLDDRKPDYIFDPFDSVIYYFSSNSITAYKI
ncbi:MAG: hypothetical protein IE931_11410 [Sphingobacteriales bacterium]|nr:hypothetical protein [Sphingobacteriales bacterium]